MDVVVVVARRVVGRARRRARWKSIVGGVWEEYEGVREREVVFGLCCFVCMVDRFVPRS